MDGVPSVARLCHVGTTDGRCSLTDVSEFMRHQWTLLPLVFQRATAINSGFGIPTALSRGSPDGLDLRVVCVGIGVGPRAYLVEWDPWLGGSHERRVQDPKYEWSGREVSNHP